MRQFSCMTLVTLAATVVLPISAFAGPGAVYGYHDQGHTLKVALWGDNFYNADPAMKEAMKNQTINSMNRHHLDFTIFAGDTKNGSSECSNQAIGTDVINIFNSLDVPTLYTLGDNEWTDCHRSSNSRPDGTPYDPIERLGFLRQTFFNKSTTQGLNPIPVERQGILGQAYSENSRFEKDHVEFVALHIPGSNNNFVASEKQCTKKSDRSETDCAAATASYLHGLNHPRIIRE